MLPSVVAVCRGSLSCLAVLDHLEAQRLPGPIYHHRVHSPETADVAPCSARYCSLRHSRNGALASIDQIDPRTRRRSATVRPRTVVHIGGQPPHLVSTLGFELVLPAAIRAVVQGRLKDETSEPFVRVVALKHTSMKRKRHLHMWFSAVTVSKTSGGYKSLLHPSKSLILHGGVSAMFALQNSLNTSPLRTRIVAFGLRRQVIVCRYPFSPAAGATAKLLARLHPSMLWICLISRL